MNEAIKRSLHARHDESGFRVLCFGLPYDWAIRDDAPEAADAQNQGLLERFAAISDEFRIEAMYMPNPADFSAKVANDADFVRWHGYVFRGTRADGVMITRHRDAFAVTSSDCPTVVICDPATGNVAAAHAGRFSLIDRGRFDRRIAKREHQSVVDALIAHLGKKEAGNYRGYIACGIGPRNFRHPSSDRTHGEFNARMMAYVVQRWGASCVPGGMRDGQLWLTEVARRQMVACGMDPAQIGADTIDTYGTHDRADNRPCFHSHRRRTTGGGRNLVVVQRTS